MSALSPLGPVNLGLPGFVSGGNLGSGRVGRIRRGKCMDVTASEHDRITEIIQVEKTPEVVESNL